MGAPDHGPDPARRLALAAATAAPDEAAAAWRELVTHFDLAELWDPEVYRLLPLVWHRLGDEVGAAHGERLKGAYRKAWVTNQHLRRCGREAVAALGAEEVDALVVAGLALGPLFYDDPATRPAHTVDLLVRPDDLVRAWRTLEALGYRTRTMATRTPRRWRGETDDGWFARTGRSRGFTRGPLDAVEVHPDLVAPPRRAPDRSGTDAPAPDPWAGAEDLELGDGTVRTLSPTHHLFRALAERAGGRLRPTVDALTVVRRAGGAIDWPGLLALGRRHHVSLDLADGLARLDHLGADLPDGVRAAALEASPDRRERLAHRLGATVAADGSGDRLAAADLVARTRGLGPVALVVDGPRLVADHWRVDRPRHLPLLAAWHVRNGWRERRNR